MLNRWFTEEYSGTATADTIFPSIDMGSTKDMSIQFIITAITLPAGATMLLRVEVSNNNVNWLQIREFSLTTPTVDIICNFLSGQIYSKFIRLRLTCTTWGSVTYNIILNFKG